VGGWWWWWWRLRATCVIVGLFAGCTCKNHSKWRTYVCKLLCSFHIPYIIYECGRGLRNATWQVACSSRSVSWTPLFCRLLIIGSIFCRSIAKLKCKGGFTHSMPCSCRALIHTCHAVPLPCSNSAVFFVKARVVAGNIRTASPTV
jgi:hypothetical protein